MNPQLKLDLDHIITHAEPLLRELDGKCVIITGANGFYGKWVTKTLMNYGHMSWFAFDTRFEDECPHMEGGTDYYLLHFAHDHDSVENNIVGMKRVLDFAVANKVKKVLFASSGAAAKYIDTNTPKGKLGATKLLCEAMGCEYAKKYGFDFLISRGYSFVGPMMNLDRFAIGQFIKQGLAGGPIIVENPGTVRGYLHAADLVISLLDILLRGASCVPHQTGNLRKHTMTEVASLVSDMTGAKWCIMGPGHTDTYVRSHLGDHQVTIGLEEAISRTLTFYRLEATGGG